jgi:hypothetical protein
VVGNAVGTIVGVAVVVLVEVGASVLVGIATETGDSVTISSLMVVGESVGDKVKSRSGMSGQNVPFVCTGDSSKLEGCLEVFRV